MLPELREDPELFAATTSAQFGISPVLGLRPVPGRERAVLEKLNIAIGRAADRETGLGSASTSNFASYLAMHAQSWLSDCTE